MSTTIQHDVESTTVREEESDRGQRRNQDNVQDLQGGPQGSTTSNRGSTAPPPQAGDRIHLGESRATNVDGPNLQATSFSHPLETSTQRTLQDHGQGTSDRPFEPDFTTPFNQSSRPSRHSINGLNIEARRQSEETFQSPTPTYAQFHMSKGGQQMPFAFGVRKF